MFTKEELLESFEYKYWIYGFGDVVLIHNTYYDDPSGYAAFIVITKFENLYTITRFFKTGNKIQVSVDYENITPEEVFNVLLTKYSSGLR